MKETLIMAGQLLLGLGLLVFIHELGHFLAARAFGIRVEKFYVFFDFNGIKLFSKKIGDTEYGIGWFPLGGYVKIAGMIDESQDAADLSAEPQHDEFRTKPAWQRLIVMMGGIIMNVLLGIIIFTFVLLHYNKTYIQPTAIPEGIYAYEVAQKYGLQTGDQIVAINGDPVERLEDVHSAKLLFAPELTVVRNGDTLPVITLPDSIFEEIKGSRTGLIGLENFEFYVDSVVQYADKKEEHQTQAYKVGMKKGDRIVALNNEPVMVFGDLKQLVAKYDSLAADVTVVRGGETLTFHIDSIESGTLGFHAGPNQKDKYEPYAKPYSFGQALSWGTKDGLEAIYYNAKGLWWIMTGRVSARDSVQSPIGIARIYGGEWEWGRFWKLTGLISFILAFMNFLPIPALDGGHVMFIIIEVIQGKPVSEAFMERAQKVGIVILMGLMVFAFGNDILKLFGI
ncbi:RIP metalloprotease RseP [soil metagenome]